MSARSRIKRIYKNARNPLDRLWHWATGKHGGKRFGALAEWAHDMGDFARRHGHTLRGKAWSKRHDAYLTKKKAWLRHHHDPKPHPGDGGALLVSFDGHLVARWMVEEALQPARASGVWQGSVFSGYRSPEYSESLCRAMCGAPSCPGRCAGASSNHSAPPTHTGKPYEGAVDVTDSAGLQRWCAGHGYPIRGNGSVLPADTPHFSRSGR